MNKIKYTILFIALAFSLKATSQIISLNQNKLESFNKTEPDRVINTGKKSSLSVEYKFKGFKISHKYHENTDYQIISIKGLGKTNIPGKPVTPSRTDITGLPANADIKINIIDTEYEEFDNYILFPGFKPLTDDKNDSLVFTKDNELYSKDLYYPENPVENDGIMQFRESDLQRVKINPVQFNPAKNKVRVYSKIKYEIIYNSDDFSNYTRHNSVDFIKTLKNIIINDDQIPKKLSQRGNSELNYLIITTPQFYNAAEKLAEWKNQLGLHTKIIAKTNWTVPSIKDSISFNYSNYTPHPDHVLFIGDHESIPSEMIDIADNFVSDLYYVCMNGPGDFHPDMGKGRISADSHKEAMDIVDKIISYEKDPPLNQAYYNNATHCAQFQDNEPDGYANRRFTHTSEEIKNYVESFSYNVSRIYYTDSSVNPQYYNNGYYSDGQAIPPALLRSNGFPWNGNHQQIADAFNQGSFYFLHRDHGSPSGWAHPNFKIQHFDQLQNQGMYPVVFSINCSSGHFYYDETFAEALLKRSQSGAAGVIAASNTSYSGFNDALSVGFFDAIWSNPGLSPDFGSAGVSNPQSTPHSNIHAMGHVLNHGLIRMSETYGDNNYQYELFHYFGDPSMKIITQYPDSITATVADTVECGDTSLNISNSSCPDCLATLVIGNEIAGSVQLTNGTGTINFDSLQLSANIAKVTISGINKRPFTKELVYQSCPNKPEADFIAIRDSFSICSGSTKLLNISSNLPDSNKWIITPQNYSFINGTNDTSANPVILFNSTGLYTVKLIVSNNYGTDTLTKNNFIKVTSPLSLPVQEDFESDTTITKLRKAGWEFSNNSLKFQWALNSDSTPSSYTGPAFDHTQGNSDGKYIYTEASGANLHDTAYLTSPCIEIPGVSIPILTFWYHLHGSDIYRLYIDVRSGGTWNNGIHMLQGEQQEDYSDAWIKDTADLSAFAGNTAQIRFRAIRGESYKSDFAIDDIRIDTSTFTPEASFKTEDVYTCKGFQVRFYDESCCGINTLNWQFQGGMPSAATSQNPVVNYTSAGSYDVKLTVTNNFGTDSIIKSGKINVGTDKNIPVSEDFETFVSGNPGTFKNDWKSYKSDEFEWNIGNGSTPSSGTGPNSDHTTGTSGGKYVYTEASYVTEYEKAYLFTPCLSKLTSQHSILTFWYHMNISDNDTLHIDVNNGSGWQNVFYLEGPHQTSQYAPWEKQYFNLTPFVDNDYRIRFRSFRGDTYKADISIDDVLIDTLPPFMHSMNADTLEFDTVQYTSQKTKIFSFYNTGSMPFIIDTVSSNSPFSINGQSYSGTLNPGDSVNLSITFNPDTSGYFNRQLNISTSKGNVDYTVTGIAVNYSAKAKQNIKGLNIYPNPADDSFFFRADKEFNLDIYDLNGELVKNYSMISNKMISCKNLKSGVYILKISNNEKSSFKKLIIK